MLYGETAFDAIFPAPVISTPTPVATPAIGFIQEGQSFGGVAEPWCPGKTHTRRLLATSTSRAFLSNVSASLKLMSANGVQEIQAKLKAAGTRDTLESIRFLVQEWPDTAFYDDDLLQWYINYVRADFCSHIAPHLNEIWSEDELTPIQQLARTCEILFYTQRIYSIPVTDYMLSVFHERDTISDETMEDGEMSLSRASKFSMRFSKSLHAIFIENLPSDPIFATLTALTYKSCMSIFRVNHDPAAKPSSRYEIRHEASLQMMQLFENLKDVGLGGDRGVRAFAIAMEELITQFVRSAWMEVDWEQQQPVVNNLTIWVEKAFTPFVKRAITCLTGADDARLVDESKQWLDMAIAWLGKSRIDNLFDYICLWPNSMGAILDLKVYAKTPEARKYLTTKFHQDVERRLLHAGATTKHILDIYMLTIQVFTSLDSRGVLLDNVSRPIRKYLKIRGDTAKVIISSMLADVNDPTTQNSSDISKAIAEEMLKPINLMSKDIQRQDHDLDYDNMNYVPQPSDASPDFRRNESNESIGHLLSLYDREQYVTVLRNIFGEHLLKTTNDVHLEKETHLLELFKARFGDEKLQACEVMLRDISNSRRLNKKIVSMSQLPTNVLRVPGELRDLNAQILSSYFWPDLRDDEFEVPELVRSLQRSYDAGFQSHHNLMRLKWLPALGRATVELRLMDRTVSEVVPTWVATIINLFATDDNSSITKSVAELEQESQMDETLVRNALSFWVGKHVLQETHLDHFTVLETLSDDQQHATNVVVSQEQVSAVKSDDDILDENAAMYKMFIGGMLMNAGGMTLQRIHQMLKIAIPGGFPFGESDLRSLLQGMIDDSRLMSRGDVYVINTG